MGGRVQAYLKKKLWEKAEEFAHQMSESPYTKISFLVKETKKSDADADQWFLVGDLRLSEGGETKCFKGMLVANLDGGKWYFRPLGDSIVVPVDVFSYARTAVRP